MNLQSKFGYCIITHTLNIAHSLYAGRNNGQTDGRPDRQTDRRSDYYMRPTDLSGRGFKGVTNKPTDGRTVKQRVTDGRTEPLKC